MATTISGKDEMTVKSATKTTVETTGGTTDVKASAALTVDGKTTTVKASDITTIQGGTVNIN